MINYTDDLPGIENEPPEPPVWPQDNGRCDFCFHPAHLGACAELQAFAERVKAGIRERVLSMHPCPSCGDMTAGDCCAACQEWGLASFAVAA